MKNYPIRFRITLELWRRIQKYKEQHSIETDTEFFTMAAKFLFSTDKVIAIKVAKLNDFLEGGA